MLRRSFFRRKLNSLPDKPIVKLPGRKGLDDIVKLSLLEAAPTEVVTNIWHNHHQQYPMYWGRVMPSTAYLAMRPRLSACPYFVIPVFRDKGLFNVVTNFNTDIIGVVPLGEFQKKGDHAVIHMTVQFFTELSQSKGLVLVRCEIQDKVMTKTDCVFLTQMLLKYYTMPALYEAYVETFNRRPHAFDYHAFLRHMKDEAGKDSVQILDKKSSPLSMERGSGSGVGAVERTTSSSGLVMLPPGGGDAVLRALRPLD